MQSGRGKKLSKPDQLKVLQMYCDTCSEDEYLFNLDEISDVLELAPRTVKLFIRGVAVSLITKHVLANGLKPKD